MEQRYARPRKPASRGAVCDGLDYGFDGDLVNKFPTRHHNLAQPLRGIPRLRRTLKPAVPAGHGSARKRVPLSCVATASRPLADWCPWACAKLAERSNRAKSFRVVPCPAKRVSVSAGSGGDAKHRKGMGWRCPCLHGTAQSLALKAANGGPPQQRLPWLRAAHTFQRNEISYV